MSLDSTNSPAQAPITQLRVLAATLGGALVVLAVALYFAAGNLQIAKAPSNDPECPGTARSSPNTPVFASPVHS